MGKSPVQALKDGEFANESAVPAELSGSPGQS